MAGGGVKDPRPAKLPARHFEYADGTLDAGRGMTMLHAQVLATSIEVQRTFHPLQWLGLGPGRIQLFSGIHVESLDDALVDLPVAELTEHDHEAAVVRYPWELDRPIK